MKKEITLIFTPLIFYSPEDEALFFAWIDKVNIVKGYKGIGEELHVYINTRKKLTFNDFRNFHGLFKRYKLENIEQLKVLMNKENEEWFMDFFDDVKYPETC